MHICQAKIIDFEITGLLTRPERGRFLFVPCQGPTPFVSLFSPDPPAVKLPDGAPDGTDP